MPEDREVRYWMLRPKEIVAARNACPAVYIPIGNLEWHGLHNPTGTDTLQAEGMAIRCAQKGGGLVFPPLYYGENRLEALMEANAPDKEEIAAAMDVPAENFSPERSPYSATEQTLSYQRLLIHILAEAESLGFRVGVLVAGHYPLIDHARAAVMLFNQRHYSRHGGMLAWAFVDYLLLADRYDYAGDHAAGWETSHMLALYPQTVDMHELPEKGERLVGVGGKLAPQDATEELGAKTMDEAADIAVREVRHRLDNTQAYRGHGRSLVQGLWKSDS
jgi:creatinine amidohydrolase